MARKPLLPDRYPTPDFFIADIFDALPIKGDRHTLEHPFFSLSTKKDTRSIEYQHGGIKISLHPSAKWGLPTMMDKDILLYVGSVLMAEINDGNIPPKKVRFSAHDLLVTTNRMTTGRGYELLKNAFERITGCLITTDIKTSEIKEAKGFHILESYEIIESSHDKKRMVRLEVTVSDWFYNALVGKEVLTINREYFRLRKSLERRLYELARKHCGKQKSWYIKLDTLQEKSGSQSDINKFRHQIRQIIKTNHIPDYLISLVNGDIVKFSSKSEIAKQERSHSVDIENLPRIRHDTLLKAEKILAHTRWDFSEVRKQFSESIFSGAFKPDDINAAFIGFCKNKAKQQP